LFYWNTQCNYGLTKLQKKNQKVAILDIYSLIFEDYKVLNLASKAEKDVSFNWIAKEGNYTIMVVVDPDDLIDEADERNNVVSKPFKSG